MRFVPFSFTCVQHTDKRITIFSVRCYKFKSNPSNVLVRYCTFKFESVKACEQHSTEMTKLEIVSHDLNSVSREIWMYEFRMWVVWTYGGKFELMEVSYLRRFYCIPFIFIFYANLPYCIEILFQYASVTSLAKKVRFWFALVIFSCLPVCLSESNI